MSRCFFSRWQTSNHQTRMDREYDDAHMDRSAHGPGRHWATKRRSRSGRSNVAVRQSRIHVYISASGLYETQSSGQILTTPHSSHDFTDVVPNETTPRRGRFYFSKPEIRQSIQANVPLQTRDVDETSTVRTWRVRKRKRRASSARKRRTEERGSGGAGSVYCEIAVHIGSVSFLALDQRRSHATMGCVGYYLKV